MSTTWQIMGGDALAVLGTLPDARFHCCVTSPPYWGLRDYGVEGQLGLEKTPEEYVAKMVAVFREVRRVLRDDGTLWLNIGDTYCSDDKWGGGSSGKHAYGPERHRRNRPGMCGCKPKDLVGIPWLLAFALRADGWWLRSEIIWHKRAPMPESVTDRPTKAHEQVFLLTKSQRYFYDSVAASEPAVAGANGSTFTAGKTGSAHPPEATTRNLRSVWPLSPESFKGAHFATMPTELARRCLLAGTSERGCCVLCGAPIERQVKRTAMVIDRSERTHEKGRTRSSGTMLSPPTSETIGWQSPCECGAASVPCRVLDPFSGAGTTGVVARRLGLHYTGIELNTDYADMSRQRIRDDAPLLNAG